MRVMAETKTYKHKVFEAEDADEKSFASKIVVVSTAILGNFVVAILFYVVYLVLA